MRRWSVFQIESQLLTCVQYSHGAWFLDGRTSILVSTQMTSKGHQKVKSEVAPYLKITFVVHTNYVLNFTLYPKVHKKCLKALLHKCTVHKMPFAAANTALP